MTAVSQYSDVEYVFEPHSNTLPNVREYMKALWDRRHFMRELASADLRALQSGKVLGNLWSVLNPLYQAAIYYFLYAVLRPGSNQAFLPILIPNFFLFFGLSMAAMSDGGSSVKRGRGLMLNSAFPRALLPITAVYKSLRLFVPAACVLAVIYPLVGGRPGPGFFVLPLLFAIQVVMNIGIALAVSTYEVLVPDGTDLVQWLTRLLFFATPVIYPVALLPPAAKAILQFQPLFPLFAAYQAIFGGGTPSPALVLQAALWAGALLVIGGRAFLRHEREFALYL
ncbi:MAG TPA: ABC transporter permease [Acidimicrobiales bacterium]|jgi:teichoic acid transport system permease protein|nr:ABC transporter permease [Acidimicrobiales bacterium]